MTRSLSTCRATSRSSRRCLFGEVAHALAERDAAAIATAAVSITDTQELFNPNAVKVVCDASGYALYFSRAPIPYARDAFGSGQS